MTPIPGTTSTTGTQQPTDGPQSTPPPQGAPTDTGTKGAQGQDPGKGAPPPGGDAAAFGGDLASTLPQTPAEASGAALCDLIAQNTASLQSDVQTSNNNAAADSSGFVQTRAESSQTQDAFLSQSDTHAEAHRGSEGEALASGDTKVIVDRFLTMLTGTGRTDTTRTGAALTQAQLTQTQGQQGQPLPTRTPTGGGDGTQTRTPGGPTQPEQPPIFPNATGRLATLTQPRMQAFAQLLQNMPKGQQKTDLQQQFDQLQHACAEGNQAGAEQILAGHPELAEALEQTQDTDETGTARTGDGDDADKTGEGRGVTGGRSGEGSATTTRTAVRFSPDKHLQQGITVFSRSGDGSRSEGEDHLTRMGTGLRVICGGTATRSATAMEGAIHGRYGDQPGDEGGGGSGSGSGDSSVEFGRMTDTDGALAAGGYRLDTAAAGLGGSYGVRTADGKFIPQWLAASDRGGLPPGVRAAIARDASMRTRFGAEALSGHRAQMTGDLFAGARC